MHCKGENLDVHGLNCLVHPSVHPHKKTRGLECPQVPEMERRWNEAVFFVALALEFGGRLGQFGGHPSMCVGRGQVDSLQRLP